MLKDEELFATFTDKTKLRDQASQASELFSEQECPGLATRMLPSLPVVPPQLSEFFRQ